jgi:hypothetical protein
MVKKALFYEKKMKSIRNRTVKLKKGEFWEDVYDSLTVRQRAHEPRESLESVKKYLHKQGRLRVVMTLFVLDGDTKIIFWLGSSLLYH